VYLSESKVTSQFEDFNALSGLNIYNKCSKWWPPASLHLSSTDHYCFSNSHQSLQWDFNSYVGITFCPVHTIVSVDSLLKRLWMCGVDCHRRGSLDLSVLKVM
jgi:hypothetical protein